MHPGCKTLSFNPEAFTLCCHRSPEEFGNAVWRFRSFLALVLLRGFGFFGGLSRLGGLCVSKIGFGVEALGDGFAAVSVL